MEEMQMVSMEEIMGIYPAQKGKAPWRRLWARALDGAVFATLVLAVLSPLLPKNNYILYQFSGTIQIYFGYLLMLFIEPFLIAKFGTTPGKRLFGIRLVNADGEKLDLEEAKERTRMVYRLGLGYCIPFYDMYRQYRSWGTCVDGALAWDESISYEVQENKVGLRIVVALVLNLLLRLATTFAITGNL